MKKFMGTLCVAALAATIVVAQEAAKKPADKKAAAPSGMSHSDMGAATKSPYVGTWKLNLEKSQYSDPAMKPKSATLHITKWDANTIAWNFTATDAKGKAMSMSYSAPNDGKTHKVTGDPQTAGAEFKVSGNDVDIEWKDAKGNTVGTEHAILAADGKSFSDKQTFKGQNGKDVTMTEVYDKAAGGAVKAAKQTSEKK